MQNPRPARVSQEQPSYDFEQPPVVPEKRQHTNPLVPAYALPLVIVLLVVATYAIALRNSLQVTWGDDVLLISNPLVSDFSFGKLPDILTEFGFGVYSPLPMLIHGLQDTLLTNHYGLYHAVSVIFHALNAVLVYLTLSRLTNSQTAALIAALLFAVHPIQVESVAWVSQLRTVLGLFFFLLAFSSHLTSTRKRPPAWALPAAWGCFLLSILCMPQAVLGGLIFISVDVLFTRRSLAQALPRAVPYLVIGGVGIAITLYAQRQQPGGQAGLYGDNLFEHIQIIGRVIWDYAASLVLPIKLNNLYVYKTDGNLIYALLGFGVVALTLVFAFLAPFGRAFSTFAVIWLWVLMLPVANIIPMPLQRFDHHLYMPSVLIFAVVGALFVRLWERFRAIEASRYALTAIIGGLIVGCIFLSITRVGEWKDSGKLWAAHLEDYPTSELGLLNLGVYHYSRGNVGAAQVAFVSLLGRNPDIPRAQRLMGNLMFQMGDYQRSVEYYQAYSALVPEDDSVIDDVGIALVELGVQSFNDGQPERALAYYAEAVRLVPNYEILHNNVGYTLYNMGQFNEAIVAYNRAIELYPDYARAWINLGNASLAAEQYQLAAVAFQRALELNAVFDADSFSNYCVTLTELRTDADVAAAACSQAVTLAPDNALHLARTASMSVNFGQPAQALPILQRALELNPQLPLTFRVIGDAYRALGDNAQAEAAYRQALELQPNNTRALEGLGIVTGQVIPQPTPPPAEAPPVEQQPTEAPPQEAPPTPEEPTPEPTPTVNPYGQ